MRSEARRAAAAGSNMDEAARSASTIALCGKVVKATRPAVDPWLSPWHTWQSSGEVIAAPAVADAARCRGQWPPLRRRVRQKLALISHSPAKSVRSKFPWLAPVCGSSMRRSIHSRECSTSFRAGGAASTAEVNAMSALGCAASLHANRLQPLHSRAQRQRLCAGPAASAARAQQCAPSRSQRHCSSVRLSIGSAMRSEGRHVPR